MFSFLQSFCIVVIATTAQRGSAFSLVVTPVARNKVAENTKLYSTAERVKRAGAGIPIVPSGNRELFDPAEQGKLQGTNELNDRLSQGASYVKPYLPAEPVDVPDLTLDAQHWLEDFGPKDYPSPFAKAAKPVTATILGRMRLIDENAEGDIEHIVMQLPDGMHYAEGQSLSVIPPGTDPKTRKPHKPRLYSIASTRYGDLLDGKTVSLCVRRAEYTDPATGTKDPTKKGVCSNFLCDAPAGQKVQVAGPVGATMLLPNDLLTKQQDLILVATGTGIAPFRGFLHRLFVENTVTRHMYNGKVWLILGVPTSGNLLYAQEFEAIQDELTQLGLQDRFKVTYAISREQKNKLGGKLYVQDVLIENADYVFDTLLNKDGHIYFCGLKGMMPGITSSLEDLAGSRGMEWSAVLNQFQKNKQWHVEVY